MPTQRKTTTLSPSDVTIIVDTREKVNGHLTEYFDSKNIPYVIRKLDHGDYSVEVRGISCESEICIERKHSLNEISGNLAQERERFAREFERYRKDGTKPFIIIEDASWHDILLHNYQTKLNPKSLFGSLLAWQIRYNITIVFCPAKLTGQMVFGILWYYAKERYEHGVEEQL